MNKKLNEALDREIARFKEIGKYQDNLIKESGPYQFYKNIANEDENEPDPAMDQSAAPAVDNTQAPPMDAAPAPDAGAPADPAMGGGDAVPMPDANAAPDAGIPGDDMGADPSMGGDPAMGGAPADPAMGGDDQTTEIDITDLVNNSNEIKMKVSDALTKIDSSNQQFSALINKISAIEGSLGQMNSLVTQMGELSKQVAYMRPPTEAERRQALAKDSYPFSVTMDDYANGTGDKTQTDLEKNKDPKMSMMKTLMNNYNDAAVKDSFYAGDDNPLKQF